MFIVRMTTVPDADYLRSHLGFQPDEGQEVYLWKPDKKPLARVTLSLQPGLYAQEIPPESRDALLSSVRELGGSSDLIAAIEKGTVVSDEVLLRAVEARPELDRTIQELNPVAGFARRFKGTPHYGAQITSVSGAYEDRDEHDRLLLAQYLATRHRGLFWDTAKHRYGIPLQRTVTYPDGKSPLEHLASVCQPDSGSILLTNPRLSVEIMARALGFE